MHAGIKGPPSSDSGDHALIFRSSRNLIHKKRDFLRLDVAHVSTPARLRNATVDTIPLQ